MRVVLLAVVTLVAGGPSVWGLPGPDLPRRPPSVQETDLPPDRSNLIEYSEELQPENLVLSACERSFAIGEFLWSCGRAEDALAQFTYALERLALNWQIFDTNPMARSRIYLLLMRAANYRRELEFFRRSEEDREDMANREIPPVERLEEDDGVNLHPDLEAFIQDNIRNGGYNIPITLNRQVGNFLGYFSDPKRKRSIEIGLQRLGRYRGTFERIFREEGIPLDLIFLGMVESNYSPNAYSRAKAKGIWQFIEETGRNYGLRIDWWVDERCDFEKSTRSACRYLKTLYEMFGDWNLAMAAYNSGENRILKILSNQPGKSFWEMCSDRNLPLETRNYVPAIQASVIISKHPDRFGLTPRKPDTLAYVTVEIPSPTDLRILSRIMGIPDTVLQDLNPSLRRMVTPPDTESYLINVPTGIPLAEFARVWDMPDFQRIDAQTHTVSDGETIHSIARKYDVAIPTLKDFNRIKDTQPSLPPGTVLQIPLASSYKKDLPQFRFDVYGKQDARYHKVRKGESLSSLCRKYGVSVKDVRKWNKLGKKSIRPGMVLSFGPSRSKGKGGGSREPGAVSTDGGTYQVRKGDTPASIAKKLKISTGALLSANNLKSGARLKAGTRLRVPDGGPGPGDDPGRNRKTAGRGKGKTGEKTASVNRKGTGKAPVVSEGSAGKGKTGAKTRPARSHKVRKGDTLFSLARKYGVDVAALKKANHLKSNDLRPGATLVVP
ncbi:MAG: LysM peptidoglycan-binding domain-containing protein [Acidobacteria bacterium]|nr:LysM peptidoglycan-binding domain-containing protein [Acidobacteriota bacterium]